MIGADIASTNHERPAGVAESLQCSEHGVCAPSSEISAVFKSEPTRSDFADDADGLEVEAAALAFDTLALGVGAADVLAGWTSDDEAGQGAEIGQKSGCCKHSHVFIETDSGVILGIDGAAPID
jgi:hypothetical protein